MQSADSPGSAGEPLTSQSPRFGDALRRVLDNLFEGCMLIDFDWRYIYANESAARHGLQKVENLVGRTMQEMYPGVESTPVFAAYRRCMEQRTRQHFEAPYTFTDGTTRWFEFNVDPVPEGIFVLSQDITEHKKAEQALVDETRKLHSILDSMAEAVVVADTKGTLTEFNDAAVRLHGGLGRTGASVPVWASTYGIFLEDRVTPCPPDEVPLARAIRGEKPDRVRLYVRRPDGSGSPVEVTGRPILGADGTIVGGVVVFSDITERSRNERQLARLTRVYEVFSRTSQVIVRATDRQRLFEDACRIAVEAGGFRMSWIGLLDPKTRFVVPAASSGHVDGYLEQVRISIDDVPEGRGPTGRAMREDRPFACRDIAHDPVMAPWCDAALRRGYRSSAALPLHLGGSVAGVYMVYSEELDAFGADEVELLQALARDLSFALESMERARQRDEAERALRDSQARFQSMIENVSDAIVVVDADGRVRYASPAAARIARMTPDELRALNAFDPVHPDDRERFRAAVDEALATADRPVIVEFRYRVRGDEVRTLEATVSHLAWSDGSRVAVIASRDITDRRILEEQFRQAQKMEAVGRLAGGIAHDFNNLLTAILGYSELLLGEVGRDDPHRAGIEEIERAGRHASVLVNQLLAFSRRQVLQPKIVDPNEIVANVEGILRRLIGEDIALEISLAERVHPVCVDAGQMAQVLINLAVNARDAMKEGGRLTIETSNLTFGEPTPVGDATMPAGDYVRVSVADTGCGMTDEVKKHLFEPFFTTKEIGKGTGLGLATVYGAVKQASGAIECRSQAGAGSTFTIVLPKAEAAVPAGEPKAAAAGSERGRETILVVEDEAVVRALTSTILRRLGYRVIEAKDGRDALRLLAEATDEVDLVLTDVVMPQLGGPALAEEVHRLKPSLKVVFMSGYVEGPLVTGAIAPLITKPFTPSELGRAVRAALDGPALQSS